MAPSPFLSTLPARGATGGVQHMGAHPAISIHAPREGSDPQSGRIRCPISNFYPRSPRGERHFEHFRKRDEAIFLSTLPARGATR